MLTSEYIENFLNFLSDAKTRYDIAQVNESEYDKQTQDILHRLELVDDEKDYQDKLLDTIKEIRHERRKAKDESAVLFPVITWRDNNPKVISMMQQLLGDVRKVQRQLANRVYVDRTDIVKDVGERVEEQRKLKANLRKSSLNDGDNLLNDGDRNDSTCSGVNPSDFDYIIGSMYRDMIGDSYVDVDDAYACGYDVSYLTYDIGADYYDCEE